MKTRPMYMFDNIFDITPKWLNEIGVKGVICDIDDTLVGHGVLDIPKEVIDWFDKLKANGLKVCLLSNNNQKRVNDTLKKLDLQGVHSAIKPFKRGYKKAMDLLEEDAKKIAFIGDQIYTDILGANMAGMVSILVDPITKSDLWYIKLKRIFEHPVLKKGPTVKNFRK